MTSLVRSWLYAPGHHPDLVRKALGSGADAVVIDLEDSVPRDRKVEAREGALSILRDLPGRRPAVWARINTPGTEVAAADVQALATTAVDGVRVPRAEDPDVIPDIAEAVGRPIHLLIETAVGLMAAPELARAHPNVVGISLGEADLAADLGVGPDGLDWARGWVVAVARANGLPSPIQSVYTDVGDVRGLLATTRTGRALGFFGRSIIHPRQITPVHAALRPSPREVLRAEEILEALAEARTDGDAGALTADGRFVDPAVAANAQRVLDLAHFYATTSPRPEPS